MAEDRKIRLGIVRTDLHAYYYGVMMSDVDPMLLLKNMFIAHWYATDIYDPTKIAKFPRYPEFEIVKCFDRDRKTAETFSETFKGTPKVCDTLDEVANGIDAVFVSDCDGGGGDHLELVRPFLERGIPAFVDKPFASSVKDAKAIIALAESKNVPIYNASILSYVPAADLFKNRFEEIAPVGLGVVKGVGGAFSPDTGGGQAISGGIEERLAYIIHGISLGLNMFGKGVEWVEAMGTLPLEYLHLHLKSGMEILIMNTSVELFPESCSFYVSAYSANGTIHSDHIGDPEFRPGAARIVANFRDMILTGKTPRSYDDILEHIAVVEAGQIAHQTRQRVNIEDVLKGS